MRPYRGQFRRNSSENRALKGKKSLFLLTILVVILTAVSFMAACLTFYMGIENIYLLLLLFAVDIGMLVALIRIYLQYKHF